MCAPPGWRASLYLVLSCLADLNVSGSKELMSEKGWEVWRAFLFLSPSRGRNVEPGYLGLPTPHSEKN